MTEDEVNKKCRLWLEGQGYKYKGILNTGLGQVPVPDGIRQVLIDHQGHKDRPVDLCWVEAKGSGVGFSMLFQGLIRVIYAVYHGGGKGLLAIPEEEYELLLKQRQFLEAVVRSSERVMGLLNADSGEIIWFK